MRSGQGTRRAFLSAIVIAVSWTATAIMTKTIASVRAPPTMGNYRELYT